ncbi:MAG: tetratricopeptide repeat protein [Alphaproteobacteria bacterium]|jgi:tetratricopeptide (TPR) repeat protein
MRKIVLAGSLVALLAAPMAVYAAGSSSDDESVSIGDVKRYVDRGDYSRAISKAEDYLRDNGSSADAYNYIGYSRRQMGQYAEAKSAYDRALAVDANHVGAHEYYGELHIKMGNMAGAKQHLAELTRICGSCSEQQMLSTAIAKSQAGG